MNLCREARYICDVGANTGIYALVAKAVNPHAHVYAFEPVAKVYSKLLANCRLNNYEINCLQQAVSNYDGKATIYLPISEHIYSVTVNKNLNPATAMVVQEEVSTIKLSTFLRTCGLPRIDLMKIDVETHEVEVLEGMDSCPGSSQTTFLIEILNSDVGARIERLFEGREYLFFYLEEVGQAAFAGPRSGGPAHRHQGLPDERDVCGIERVSRLGERQGGNYLICTEATARRHSLV